jgi:outer membrane protein
MTAFGWRVAFASLFIAPAVAVAADLPSEPSGASAVAPATYTPAAPDWIVTLGIEGRMIPAWPGSKQYTPSGVFLPLFDVRKEGTPPNFFGPRDSFGINLLSSSQFKFGPAFKFITNRNQWNYPETYGLGDIGYTVQAGVFAEYWPVSWLRLRGELRQGIGGETGQTGDIFLDAIVPIGPWTLSGGPRVEFQSSTALSPYFSVTAAQSGATAVYGPPHGFAPLPVYNVSGGFYSWGAGAKVEYNFNRQWSAYTFAEYEQISGSAASSPIVTQRGTPNQLSAGLGVTYSFSMHPWW